METDYENTDTQRNSRPRRPPGLLGGPAESAHADC